MSGRDRQGAGTKVQKRHGGKGFLKTRMPVESLLHVNRNYKVLGPTEFTTEHLFWHYDVRVSEVANGAGVDK